MSNDSKITKELIETLEDGRKGFADAADKLADSDRADLAPRFRQFSEQRAVMSTELGQLAAQYGDEVDEGGSMTAALHRGWMAVKDAVTGSSPKGVLDAAEQGEDHALSEFRKALDNDISPGLRTLVDRQLREITATHNEVKRLRDSAA